MKAMRRHLAGGLLSRPAMRPGLILCFLTFAAGLAATPAAAATYTINVEGPMDLGSVAAGATGDTVFRISPSTGAVTVQSGSGRRISGASARAQVTVTCRPDRGGDTRCTTADLSIRIGTIGALIGRARALNSFTVAMGTATVVTPPTGTNPVALQLAPPGNNTPKTFFIGADFPVAGDDSGLPSGNGENGFYAYVVDQVGLNLASDTDKGRVRALRALAISKVSDLHFGRIQRPTSGLSTVTLDSAGGTRTVSGTGVGYATPAPTRAEFNIAGEGGQQVSLTIPETFNLTGPSTIAVTVNDTAPASPTLNGSLGAAGAYNFRIGGSFSLSPTTPTGAYSGVLTVSLDYN